ncbi:MAG: carboxypeptidase regulatory-like domain-containing protein, partial [Phycisphaerae bacterium]
VQIVLSDGLVLEGVVTEADGTTPVVGASVEVRSAVGQIHQTTSGEDGHFLLDTLSPGVWWLGATAADYATSREVVDVTAVASPVSVAIALSTGATLSGHIFAADGFTPIADATVELHDAAGTPLAAMVASAGGAYGFEGVQDGTYQLVASHQEMGFVPQDVEVIGGADLAIDFAAGASGLSGLVTNEATGLPVEGALVTLVPAGAAVATGAMRTTTDAAGGYAWDALVPGTYWLALQIDGLARSAGYIDVADGKSTVFDAALTAPVPISGTVRDAVSGEGAAWATILMRLAAAVEHDPGVWLAADESGDFTCDSLPAGSYRMLSKGDGYEIDRRDLDVPTGGASVTVDLTQDGSELAVTVTDAATGLPLGGAMVSLSSDFVQIAGGRTNAAGVASFEQIALGPYALRAVAPGALQAQEITISAASEEVAVSLVVEDSPSIVLEGAAAKGVLDYIWWILTGADHIWEPGGWDGPIPDVLGQDIESWREDAVWPTNPKCPEFEVRGKTLEAWQNELCDGVTTQVWRDGQYVDMLVHSGWAKTQTELTMMARAYNKIIGIQDAYEGSSKIDQLLRNLAWD